MKRILRSLLQFPMLFVIFSSWAHAGTWSVAPWTDDASSGISTTTKWAYHFGSGATATLGGKIVPGAPGSSPSAAGNFSITGVDQVFNNDANTLTALTGTGSAVVGQNFIWGGSPATVTLQGLTPGLNYALTFLSVGWEERGGRQVNFTSGADTMLVDQDFFGDNNGIRIDYEFIADATTRSFTVSPLASTPSLTFHIYGLALSQLSHGTWTISPWKDDASSGISTTTKWAYHFGSGATATLGGKSVPGVPGSSPSAAGKFSILGVDQIFNNDVNSLTLLAGSGSAVVGQNFIWGGSPATITIQGLTPGLKYAVTFLSVGWEERGGRQVNFTSGTDTMLVDQDFYGDNNGIRIDYEFTADAPTRSFILSPLASTPSLTFHIYGLALFQLPLDVSDYRFDSTSKQVVDGDGVALGGVEGVRLAQVVDKPEAVEFHFGSSLQFDLNDVVSFKGSKPVRIVVNGDVSLPAGMSINASPGLDGAVAGGGAGGPTVLGATGAKPMTVHLMYFNGYSGPDSGRAGLLNHWEDLIKNHGIDYVLPRAGDGGAGSASGGVAAPGGQGQPGIGAGVPGASEGKRGPDQDERLWDSIRPLNYGYGGAIPAIQATLPGFTEGASATGGQGWNNSQTPVSRGGPTTDGGGVWSGQCVFGFPPVCVLYTVPNGGGGTPGAAGAPVVNGGDGGHGGNGADANHAGHGNGQQGFSGEAGKYGGNSSVIPLLKGGNGGGSGSGGGGGAAGAPGGAGGGGGGGGFNIVAGGFVPFANGGKGGKGGQGKFGGAGGDGGFGGAGGGGGGAFEISATGSITVGTKLMARGADGAIGTPGQTGFTSTIKVPGHPELSVDPIGKPGSPGALVGTSRGGSGGRGGDGGEGGRGGDGGPGGNGGSGAGGTIILRASKIIFTGDPNPAAHFDVRGGNGAESGAWYAINTPGLSVNPPSVSYAIPRGAAVSDFSFAIQNTGPAGTTLNYKIETPWWISVNNPTGRLNAGLSLDLRKLHIDTRVLGGGHYSVPVTVRDADPASLLPPQTLVLNFSVTGVPDDHFGELQGGELLPAELGVQVPGNLELGGDVDSFRIDVDQPSTLECWTTGPTDTVGALYDSAGILLVSANDNFPDRNFRLVHHVTPGTYFISVAGYSSFVTGPYVLHLNVHHGSIPLLARINATDPSNLYLAWDATVGQSYRILSSTDLVRWKLENSTLYSGEGIPKVLHLDSSLPHSFYRVAEGDLHPILAASVKSSLTVANTAQFLSGTPNINFTVGVPGNFGDTALLAEGAPLADTNGIMMASSATFPLENLIAQAPSPASAVPPNGFPAGYWLATSARAANSDFARVIASVAWFPATAGWMGGHVNGDTNTHFNFDESKYELSRLLTPLYSTNLFPGNYPFQLPLVLGTRGAIGGNGSLQDSPLQEGAFLLCGANGNNEPLVAGVEIALQDGVNYAFHVWKPDGTPKSSGQALLFFILSQGSPFNWIFIPYSTPGLAAGQVSAGGGYVTGTGNYSMPVSTTPGLYHIDIPSFGKDLSQGTVLVTAADRDPRCLITYSFPDGGGIDITATRLPLTGAPTPSPCGFFFAYIPHDRMQFGPGTH